MGVAFVLYTLVGGLLMPLKTGIYQVNPLSIKSATKQTIDITIDNPGKFSCEKVYLKLKNDLFVNAVAQRFDAQKSILSADFELKLGSAAPKTDMYDLYVFANKKWMSFPSAISVEKSLNDTGAASGERLHEMRTDKSLFQGFPNRPVLNESIRNLLYHVPMWFSMITLLFISFVYSIRYLLKMESDFDGMASSFGKVAMLCGLLGCVTGAIWARVTWGAYWPRDPKLNGVAIGMLLYAAYFVVRAGISDPYQKARISAVYNVFIFPIFIALILIMPKLTNTTLHPGSGGSVGFNKYDLDSTLRLFFYPACLGWILITCWIATLEFRINKLNNHSNDEA